MSETQNLEPLLTTLLVGTEDEVFHTLLTLFPNDKTGSTPALTDCLAAYGEGRADVFNRFATRFNDDVARAEFLVSAASHAQNSGTPELSNALLTAAELKVQGIDENAELEWARRLTKLGNEHYQSARYAMAELLYDEALSIRRRVLGADHPDTATSLNNLAGLYYAQGRYEDAEPLYKEAHSTYHRALGDDHPDTAQNLNNLAALYESQGRYDDAEPLYDEALSIYRRVLGADHPDTVTSLDNLAALYRAQGRVAEAAPLFKEAVEIMERVLGAEHPHTKIVRGNYEGLLAEMTESGR